MKKSYKLKQKKQKRTKKNKKIYGGSNANVSQKDVSQYEKYIKPRSNGLKSKTEFIRVYSLNVLDPAVANKGTLNLRDVTPNLPDQDAPNVVDEKSFNAQRFNALSIKIREKLDKDCVVLLQEVSDDFVKVLCPGMDLSVHPPKSPPPLRDNPTLQQMMDGYLPIPDEINGYQFIYYRSYIMAANAQQGLLIACKNRNIDIGSIIKGNKAFSVVIDKIRYGTAHFPAGYRGNVPFDYTCQLKNVLPYDDYPCIFAADMNTPPEKFVELGAMNGFEYVNTGVEMTTCGVKFFTGIKDGLPTYGYATPNKIDGIWVASTKNKKTLLKAIDNAEEHPKVETLNTPEQYYSDHKGIEALIFSETL